MNKTEDYSEILKEIMQAGFDCAMGGDPFLSEEENKEMLEKKYDEYIKKFSEKLKTIEEKTEKKTYKKIIKLINTHRMRIYGMSAVLTVDETIRLLKEKLDTLNTKK